MAALIGCAVLLGWLLRIRVLAGILPGLSAMHVSTALAIALSGISLIMFQGKGLNRAARNAARLFSFLAALIGALTIAELVLGLRVGPDVWLAEVRSGAVDPGRAGAVPPSAALSLVFLGSALLLLDLRRAPRLAKFLAYAVLVIASLSAVGYALGAGTISGALLYAPPGIHTAWALIVLAWALLLAHPDRVRISGRLVETVAVTAAYVLTAKIGFGMAIPPGNVTAVWPPSGIALAAVLLCGERAWLGVLLGSFIANTWFFAGLTNPFTPLALSTSAVIGVGSSLQALLGALLIRNFVGSAALLDRAQSVFAFVVIEVYSCFVAPTFGVTSLCIAGFGHWAQYGHLWWTWWLGDSVGAILMAPFILVWYDTPRLSVRAGEVLEGAALAALAFAAALVVFEWPFVFYHLHFPTPYLLIPFVAWAALRFGRRGVTLALVMVSVFAIAGTNSGHGPFSAKGSDAGLLELQTFIGFLAVPALILAAAIDQFKKSETELLAARSELEALVRERTGDLRSASEALKEERVERKESEEKFWVFFEHAPDAMVMADREGKIRVVNARAEAIFGYARDEMVGQNVDMLLPGRYREKHAAHRAGYTAEPRVRPMGAGLALFGRRKNGSEFPVEISLSPTRSEGESLVTAAIRDITERKRAEDEVRRSEERFRQIVQGVKDYAIFTLDQSGIVISWGEGARAIHGYEPEEIIGRHFSALYSAEDLAWGKPEIELRIATEKGRLEDEGWRVRKDGSHYWASVVITALKNPAGGVHGFAKITRDTTERRLAEEAVRVSGQKMEVLAGELERRVNELHTVNRELEAFSYSVSHDLRTPLRHIDGFVDLLKAELGNSLGETSRHYLGVISDSARRMGMLIDDLLVFSRMGRVELQKTTVDFGHLVRDTITALEMDAKGRDVEWKVSELPRLEADPTLMGLAMTNLLSNALKYTRTRLKAVIEIGRAEGNGREAVFFVRDNGVGFDMQYADKLFGVFQRLHRSEEFEGTGIGLANVRRIIHRHGGRTWAEGALGTGASFYFTLPAGKEG